jgi:plastocyanin
MSRLTAWLLVGVSLTYFATPFTAYAEEHVVSQKGKEFSKTELTVKVGDTVVFTNDDDTSHNVFSKSDCCKFNLKIQSVGEKTSVKFEQEGIVEVRCALHPKMKIVITVKK